MLFAERKVALVGADLKRVTRAARLAGLALVAAARGEERHGGDEDLTPGRNLSAD
jgi:hypothetical protein